MKHHLTAGLVSAAAVLLASGVYYQKREEELSRRLSLPELPSPVSLKPDR